MDHNDPVNSLNNAIFFKSFKLLTLVIANNQNQQFETFPRNALLIKRYSA